MVREMTDTTTDKAHWTTTTIHSNNVDKKCTDRKSIRLESQFSKRNQNAEAYI
jgi:hypothetical protein